MKKVTAFLSSSRRKATFRAVQEFERILKEFKNIDFEYVFLSDYHLEYCEGWSSASTRGRSIARFRMTGTCCSKKWRSRMA